MKYDIIIQALYSKNSGIISVHAEEITKKNIFDNKKTYFVDFIIQADTEKILSKNEYINLIISYLYNFLISEDEIIIDSIVEYDDEQKTINDKSPLNDIEIIFNPITDKPRSKNKKAK